MKLRLSNRFLSATFATFTTICLSSGVHADSLIWDGNGGTEPNPNGGNGTWNVDDIANWWNGVEHVVWPALGGTDDDAVFGNTAGTVTLGSAITANDLTFNTTGYTITGNTLTLNGTTPTITVTNLGHTATISSIISGENSLKKSGAGTLVLSGANDYTGGTSITDGTLQISSPGNLPGALTLSGGGTLAMSAGMTLANAVTVASGQSGTIKMIGANSGTLTGDFSGVVGTLALDVSGGSGYTGIIIGNGSTGPAAGAVVKLIGTNSANHVQLGVNSTGAQSFFANVKLVVTATGAGRTFIAGGNAGTRNVQFGALDGGNATTYIGFDNASNSTVTINGVADGNYAGNIINGFGGSSGINLVKNGTATQTLSGANEYTGTTTINAGTLEIGGAGKLGNASNIYAGNIGNAGTLLFSTSANQTLSGILSGIGALTKSTGIGTLTLSGVNTYTGVTRISAGTLSVGTINNGGVAGNLGQATSAAANLVFDGGTLRYTGATASTDRSFTITDGQTGGIEITNAPTNLTISGGGAETTGALTKTGSGVLTLAGTNLYTGVTTVNAGTLNVTGSLTSNVTVNNGATLSGTGSTTGNLFLSNNSIIVGTAGTGVGNNSTGFTAVNIDTSAGGVIVSGALSGGGILDIVQFTGSWNGGSSDFILTGYRAGSTVSEVVGGGGSKKLQLQTTSFTNTWIASSGTWNNTQGAGVWQNGEDNTYYSGDTVRFEDVGVSPVAVTVGEIVTPTAVIFDNTASNYTLTGAGAIAGTTSLTKNGTGTVALNLANTYTGATTLAGGTIALGNANALGATSSIQFTGGTLQHSAANTVDYSAQIIGSTNTIRIDTNGQAVTYASALTGSNTGGLAKLGAGTLTLTGANTYTGDTSIAEGGTLALGGAGTLGASGIHAGNISNAGTLNFSSSANQTLSGVISGGGVLNFSTQGGSLTFSGTDSNTFSGTLNINTANSGTGQSLIFAKTGGAFAIGANAVINFGTGTGGQENLRMGASNQFDAGVVINFGNTVGNYTRFDLMGTNQTLAGVNSGTDTQRMSGIIQNREFNNNSSNRGTSTLTLNGSETYVFNGWMRDADNGANANNLLALVKNGSGTQTLAGSEITYTGSTTVNEGTLRLVNTMGGSTTAGFNSAITNNSIVEFNATTGGRTGGALAGSGTFNKTGAGVFRINGGQAITTTGQFNIQAGTLQNDNNAVNWANNKADIDISDGAILDLYADAIYLDVLTGSGTVQNNYGNSSNQSGSSAFYEKLVLGTNNGISGTFSGIIRNNSSVGNIPAAAGAGGGIELEKTGTGTQILSGNNTYTGTTIIHGGTLQIGDGGTSGSLGTGAVTNNAALVFNRSDDHTVANNITGEGSLTKLGGGILTLTGTSNTYTGITTIENGTLALGANTAISDTLVLGTSGGQTGTLDVSAKGEYFEQANISGNGTIHIGEGKQIYVSTTLSPGFSTGVLNVSGDLVLYEYPSTPITFMELAGSGGIAGVDFDQLNVTGSFTMAGILNIINEGGWRGTYDLFNFDSFMENFTEVYVAGQELVFDLEKNLWSFSDDNLEYTFDQTSGVLTVIPEPATALLGGLGLLALLRRRRN